MGVSENSGTPKSSIIIGFSNHKPSILGYLYFWKNPYGVDEYNIDMDDLPARPGCIKIPTLCVLCHCVSLLAYVWIQEEYANKLRH